MANGIVYAGQGVVTNPPTETNHIVRKQELDQQVAVLSALGQPTVSPTDISDVSGTVSFVPSKLSVFVVTALTGGAPYSETFSLDATNLEVDCLVGVQIKMPASLNPTITFSAGGTIATIVGTGSAFNNFYLMAYDFSTLTWHQLI